MYNLNRLQDITFEKVPSVNTGRYSIEFWFYAQQADGFQQGVNIIFENHIAINLSADSSTSEYMVMICFPQAYRDNIRDKLSDTIKNDIYYRSQNKYKEGQKAFSQWTFIRCGYNSNDGVFFMNSNINMPVTPELFWKNTENTIPYRFYPPTFSNLIIQNAALNSTRIFMQTINIYRDYLPFLDLSNRDMKFYMGLSFFPLVFAVNFNDYSTLYLGLQWFYSQYDIEFNSNNYYYDFLYNMTSPSYKTYPVYIRPVICSNEFYYEPKSNTCQPNSITPCNEKTVFCHTSDSTYFWCPKGKFLDIVKFTCGVDCPDNFTRYPNTPETEGVCNLSCTDKNLAKCPSKSDQMKWANYIQSYNCQSNLNRVYYRCYNLGTVRSNYFSFNNKYSFFNSVSDLSKAKVNEYIIDTWMMIDNLYPASLNIINTDKVKIINHLNYLFVYPHAIVADISDGLMKYTNYKSELGKSYSPQLKSFNQKEWNRVILVISLDKVAKQYETKIFINNISTPDYIYTSKSDLYDMSVMGVGFCNNVEVDTCNFDGQTFYIKWGSAFYRYIKVFKLGSASVETIYAHDQQIFQDNVDGLISNLDLTLKEVRNKKVVDLVEPDLFDMVSTSQFLYDYDQDQTLNYASGFDVISKGNFYKSINIASGNKTNYTNFTSFESGNCMQNCDRCYDESQLSCYTCSDGYQLTRGNCTKQTTTFLKLPLTSNPKPETILDPSLSDDISAISPLTFMFWMKFFGVIQSKSKLVFSVLGLFDTSDGTSQEGDNKNYLGWDTDSQTMNLYYMNSLVAFPVTNSSLFLGKWTHFGISIYNAIPEQDSVKAAFPNMLNLMVGTQIISPSLDFDIKNTYYYVNKLSLGNDISALISDLCIYSQYFVGTYGFAQSLNRNNTLMYEFPWIGKSDSDCVSSSHFKYFKGSKNSKSCTYDINENVESQYECKSYFEQSRKINTFYEAPTCINCNKSCETSCFGDSSRACSCSYDQDRYWIRKEHVIADKNEYYNFFCEEIPSLNFAAYEPTTLVDIKPGNIQYSIEVWLYIWEYRNLTFPGSDIVWNKFSRIRTKRNPVGDKIDIYCYPYSDLDFLDSSNTFSVQDSASVGQWFFVRCSTNLASNKVFINNIPETDIFLILPATQWTDNTQLLIKDYGSKESYGVFMVRELRLWNGPSYLFYDTARVKLDPSIYNNLAHYFINSFDNQLTKLGRIYDSKQFNTVKLLKSTYVKGYNYIEKYTPLTLCNEGENYDPILDICKKLTLQDIIDSIDLGKVYSASELLVRAKSINSLTNYKIQENTIFNITQIFPNYSSNSLTLKDPSLDQNFCHKQGDPLIIDRYLACSCFGGYAGTLCQLLNDDYSNYLKIYQIFAAKIWQTAVLDQSDTILKALSLTVTGANRLLRDVDWLQDMLYNITSYFDNLSYRKDHLNNYELFINLYDDLYTAIMTRFNIIKAQTLKSKFPGGGGPRNILINYAQKFSFNEILTTFNSNFNNIFARLIAYQSVKEASFPLKGISKYSYTGIFYRVDLARVNPQFNFESFFSDQSISYKPFFNGNSCFRKISQKIYFTDQYDFWFVFVSWIAPPSVFDEQLYWNYTSPSVTLKVYLPNGEPIKVDGCDNGDELLFYMPLNNPVIVDTVNNKKKLLMKGNFVPWNSTFFTDPYYIDDNGQIYNLTREERINSSYVDFYMKFDFYDLNEDVSKYTKSNYYNFTFDTGNMFYFVCNSSHLTDFMLNYQVQDPPAPLSTRFYFLSRIAIFKNLSNYPLNIALYIFILLPVIYIILTCIYQTVEGRLLDKIGFRDLLEDQFLKYIFPYGNLEEDYDPVLQQQLDKKKNAILLLHEYDDAENFKDNEDVKEISPENEKVVPSNEFEDQMAPEGVSIPKVQNKQEDPNAPKSELKPIDNQHNKDDEEEMILPTRKRMKMEENEVDPYSKDTLILKENKPPADNNPIEVSPVPVLNLDFIENPVLEIKEPDLKTNNFVTEDDKKKENKVTKPELPTQAGEVGKAVARRKIFQQNLLSSSEVQRLGDLKNLNLTFCEFVKQNLKNRHLMLTYTKNCSEFYPPYLRVAFLCYYLSTIIIFNTVGYLISPDLIINNILTDSQVLVSFIVWIIVPAQIANTLLYITSLLLDIGKPTMRKNVFVMRSNYDHFKKKIWPPFIRKRKIILILIFTITVLFWLSASYFAFGFCAVYSNQSVSFLISLLGNILIDNLIFEFLIELLVGCVFLLKNKIGVMLKVLDIVNRLRSFRTLSP